MAQYVVTRVTGDCQFMVYVWKPGNLGSMPIWSALRGPTVPVTPQYDGVFAEFPRAFLAIDDQLFLGLSSGCVEQVDMRTGKREARYGPRLVTDHAGNPKVGSICGLVNLGGTVFDAGEAGVFQTLSGERLDDRIIGSVEILDGKICIVPHGINPRKLIVRDYTTPRIYVTTGGRTGTEFAPEAWMFADSVRESNAGHLIAIPGNEIVMRDVEPFDCSGTTPGKHITANGLVYMHHGNWPDERITIRNLQTGKTVKEIPIMSTRDFVAHEGAVYDVRMCPGDGRRERITRVMRSDLGYEDPDAVLFEESEGTSVASVVSADTEGLLVALFSEKEWHTQIVSVRHQNPSANVLNILGKVKLHRI